MQVQLGEDKALVEKAADTKCVLEKHLSNEL